MSAEQKPMESHRPEWWHSVNPTEFFAMANRLDKLISILARPERVIVIKVECCCPVPPVPPKPDQPRQKVGQVSIPKGQTMSAVKFTGVKGTKASATDVVKNVFVVKVEGFQAYEVPVEYKAPHTDLPTCDLVIPKGVKFSVSDYDLDEENNRGGASVPVEGTATDGVAFDKEGSVSLPAGQTVEDSELPPMVAE